MMPFTPWRQSGQFRMPGTHLSKAIALFGLTMIALVWFTVFHVTRKEQSEAIAAVMKSNDNLARVFEDHTIRTLEGVDQVAKQIVKEYARQGKALDLPKLYSDLNLDKGLYITATIANEKGDTLLHSNEDFVPVNLSDRPHFEIHVARDDGRPAVSQPVLGRLNKRWSIVVSRRINHADGLFGGVVFIAIDPFYFTKLYETVNLGERGGISLTGMDGIVLARWFEGKSSLGQDMNGTELLQRLRRGDTSGSFVARPPPVGVHTGGGVAARPPVDGMPRVVSFHVVRGYPLAVSVAVTEAVALAEARQARSRYYAAGALITVLLLLAALILTLAARRHVFHAEAIARSESELRASRDRLDRSQAMLIEQQVALTELTRDSLLSGGDLQAVYVRITEVAARVMGADRVSIWRFADDPAFLRCWEMYDTATREHGAGGQFKLADYPAHFSALERGEIIAAENAHTHPLTIELAPYLASLGIVSILDIPIFLGGQFIGVLCCQYMGEMARWTHEQRLFGAALGNLLEIAEGHAERRQAQAALYESEQRLRALFDGIPDRVWLKDAQARYVAVNHVMAVDLGEGDGMLGKTIEELRPGDLGERHFAEDLDLLATGRTFRAERMSAVSGKWTEVIKAPVFGKDGRVSGLVGIARDITERKQIEQLNRERDREQRRAFVREIHHRIKNHIQGVAALLHRHMRRDPALADAISDAVTQLNSVAVVHGLQAAGPARLGDMLAAICAEPQHPGARATPVDLVAGANMGVMVNEDDAVPVALIINELVLNARKHIDGQAATGRVTVRLTREADGVCIAVENAGTLTPASPATDNAPSGSGLRIVRSLLPASGAELDIRATQHTVCARLTLRHPVVFGVDIAAAGAGSASAVHTRDTDAQTHELESPTPIDNTLE